MPGAPASLDVISPRFHTGPARDWTEGDLVADLLAGCSDDKGAFILDPEQRLIVDHAFAYRRTGPEERLAPFVKQLPGATPKAFKLAPFEVCVVAPRQNLKTGALKAIALGKAFISEQRLVVWTAHNLTAVGEAFRDIRLLIESNPDMLAEVLPNGFHAATSDLFIELTGDRRIVFRTRTANSAQSLSGDTVIIDEAYRLTGDFLASLLPTLAARPDPQVVYGSSAGHQGSAALRALRDRGRVGEPRLAYLEWSATPRPCATPECDHHPDADGCFYDDQDAWLECNTAVHRGRIDLDTIRGLRRAFAAEPFKFARECMCLWDDPGDGAEASPLDADRFAALVDPVRMPPRPLFVLDVSPRRSWAAVVAAGEVDGRVLVEIPSRKGVKAYRRGTAWVLATFRRMARKFPGAKVRILAKSQAAPFVDGLVKLGYDVELVPSADYPAMCVGLVQAVDDGAVVHHGEDELVTAARSGVAVDVGEEQWRWGRAKSSGDIAPLVAMTLAVDGARSERPSVYESRGALVL